MRQIPSSPELREELARICEQVRLTRRTVVGILAGGVAASGASVAAGRRQPFEAQVPAQNEQINARFLPIRLIRADDMLVLTLYLDNLRLAGGAPARRLERIQPGQPARLIFEHQPQAIEDQAIFPPPPLTSYGPVCLKSYIAGPSYVVFLMPAGAGTQPLSGDGTIAGLLDVCCKWPMSLDIAARPYGPVSYDPSAAPYGSADTNALQETLDHYSAALRSALPPEQQVALAGILTAASARVSESMTSAARSGHPLSDSQVDQLISNEVDSKMGSAAPKLGWQRLLANRSVEAAATGAAASQPRNNDVSVVGAAPAGTSQQPKPQPAGPLHRRPLAALLQAAQAASRQQQQRQPPVETRQPPVVVLPIRPLPFRRPPVSISELLNKPHPPSDFVTAIELPYRLIQSPLIGGGWKHATDPVTHGGYRTELWHTRLGARTRRGPLAPWTVDDRSPAWIRAIWSDDYPDGQQRKQAPFFALDAMDRSDIVRLTAGYDEKIIGAAAYTPRPSLARRMMLTALGGWLEAEGVWPPPRPTSVESWTHRTAMGRDYYVRVVRAGYLFPFGHAASFVQLTERRFEDRFGGSRAAVLHMRDFIVVREHSRSYPPPGRDFPFKTVDIVTKVTPDLKPVDKVSYSWAQLADGGLDFEFSLVGVDASGRRIPFTAPLCFVPVTCQDVPAYPDSRSKRALGGAMVQFADKGGDIDPSFPAEYVTFGFQKSGTTSETGPGFRPTMVKAGIDVPAIQRLMNTAAAVDVQFAQIYLDSGFDNNPQELFLEVVAGATKVGINQSDPGAPSFAGMVNPDLTPGMVSRSHGPMAGKIADAVAKPFDPGTLFPDVKLLGCVNLKPLLASVIGQAGSMPKITTAEVADGTETTYAFHCDNLSEAGMFQPVSGAALDIKTVVHVSSKGEAPRTTIDGTLSNFNLNFEGFLAVQFSQFVFHSAPGGKPHVDVHFRMPPVNLEGDMATIAEVMSYIPGGGFGDPISLSISPTGLAVGVRYDLPVITFGAVQIMNISLGAELDVSFTGDAPQLQFKFCDRHDPFVLIYDIVGGGGYAIITVDASGMRELEVSLSGGAARSLNLGIAMAQGYVLAGTLFTLTFEDDGNGGRKPVLNAAMTYDLSATLSLLGGMVSVSESFHVQFGPDNEPDGWYVYGLATLSVEVEVCFFSKSFSVTFERKVKMSSHSSSADAGPVRQLADNSAWRSYCAAFA
ncbi:MAG TPA: hypothetical protein VMU01_04150 [Rhizomicrobium sp.]|nr:hypothetical protein [Rhizomicrobium sp.]